MKKIFTLLLAATAATSAWAVAPELLFGNEPVVEDTTYETGYTVEEIDLGAMVMKMYKQNSNLYLKAEVGAEVSVEVNATSKLAICSIDAQCIFTESAVKTGVIEGDPDDDGYVVKSLEIHNEVQDATGVDPKELMEDITVEVKAYYTETPEEFSTAKVVLTNRPESEVGGIESVALDNGSVKLGYGNTLEYNLPQPTKLDIYNVNGGLVVSQKVQSIGSISLDSLHPGIYIYKAGTHSGKILVRK